MIFQPAETFFFQLLRTLVKNPKELLLTHFSTTLNDILHQVYQLKDKLCLSGFFKLSLQLTIFKPDSFH